MLFDHSYASSVYLYALYFSFKFKKGQSGVLLFKRIAVLGFAVLSIAACLVSGLSISLAVIVTVLTYIILALF
jgi:hypothetical protein